MPVTDADIDLYYPGAGGKSDHSRRYWENYLLKLLRADIAAGGGTTTSGSILAAALAALSSAASEVEEPIFVPGIKGADGANGATGAAGPAGPALFFLAQDGDEGERGPIGLQGPAGSGGAGPQGPPGTIGYDGADGEDGQPGPPGRQGVDGATGAQGPMGPALYFLAEDGVDGDRGPPGATGATGAAGGGGGGSATTVEVNVGSTATFTGKFTITDAAISAMSKVLCWQAPGPYTGKGTRADEAEMQPVQVIAVEPAAGSAVVKWQTPPMIVEARELQQGRLNAAGATFDRLSNQRWPDVFNPIRLGKVRGNIKFSYTVFA
jgi:hypothetical protein